MRAFAENFFASFGAHAFPLDDELVVELPPGLATVFGKPRLYLVFAEDGRLRDLSPAEDLLVYGSRIFDQMLSLLEHRGEATYLRLPTRFPPGSSPTLPLPLHNCLAIQVLVNSADVQFYVFNFGAAYLSDEKTEEFITIVLDVEGRFRPDKIDELLGGEPSSLVNQPAKADLRTLRRVYERAGKIARQQADTRAAELEAAIHPRLQKVLLRLTTFYRRLAEEVDSGDPAQDAAIRADLEGDLARKIADELESHRLRVTLSPLSYALALVPTAHYQVTLTTPHTQQNLELEYNQHTGQLEPFPCHYCQKPLQTLALCERGSHAVHPECLGTCSRCNQEVCRECGIEPCAICHEAVCFDCMAVCTHCEAWLCAAHIKSCSVCGEPVCELCAGICFTCGVAQCREHLLPCPVCGVLSCEEDRWPCYVCGQESCETHADLCPICGELYCAAHGLPCQSCRQTVCVQCQADGRCNTCRQAEANPILRASTAPPAPGIRPSLYDWQRAENRQFVVYLGRRRLGQAIIVADRSGRLICHAKIGLLELIAGKLRAKKS